MGIDPRVVRAKVSPVASHRKPSAVVVCTVRQTPCTAIDSPRTSGVAKSPPALVMDSLAPGPRTSRPASDPVASTIPVNICGSMIARRAGRGLQKGHAGCKVRVQPDGSPEDASKPGGRCLCDFGGIHGLLAHLPIPLR